MADRSAARGAHHDRNRGDGQRPRRSSALGSGFVISEDGYVVTNNHVIENADEIRVECKATEGVL